MAGAASAAAPALPAPPAPQQALPVSFATPALWKIQDADTTIYLFGTFHTLDGRTAWFDQRIRHAFDRSGELVLETVAPADPASAGREATTGADGRPKAFIAQTRTAISNGQQQLGLSVDHGADMVLRRVAESSGKPVAGLERFEDQLRTLASIPTAAAAQPPVPAIASPPVTMDGLLRAWKAGDTGAFSTMLAGFEAKSPVAYRMLIADRNSRWADWIAERLDRPGIVFVAVGSGHLAGKDSVQQRLAVRGIASTRVG
ncbi:TraB/GumN family protein [Sphingomonas xanthus]|uniref:TraB/GumN family protein n=1 Tax=Sphingomonas xanthus TaxID=2594473 RepID=UPI00164E22D6|nr:TraB/GumN family protein [Sphingomonas xanthus]